jgi:hypothetical protein
MSSESITLPRSGARRFLSPRGTGGQIIVFYLVFIIPMAMLMFSIYNVGQLASEKMKLQNAADNAAYSAAVWEARYMNLDGYINRAMIANYDTMAMILSLWSMADSFDGFIGFLKFVVQFIPFGIGAALKSALTPVHQGLHAANSALARAVGGSTQNKGILYVIESYTKVLSFAQEALYFLNQGGRTNVIQSIAWGVDKKIQYLGLAEVLNAVSLNSRIKWDGLNSANNFDEDKALRQTITRSLNEISRGDNFRDLGSGLLSPLNAVLKPFDLLCSLLGGGFSISLGPKGYEVKDFDEVTGDVGKPGACKPDSCDQDQIVQNDKLYQHDFAGISFEVCVVTINLGHHSDDAWNTGGSKTISGGNVNVAPPHVMDDIDTTAPSDDKHGFEGVKNFTDNGIDCSSVPTALGDPTGGDPKQNCKDNIGDTCGFNFFQAQQASNLNGQQLASACSQSLAQQNGCTVNQQGQVVDPNNTSQPCPGISQQDFDGRVNAADKCGQLFSGQPPKNPTAGLGGGAAAGTGTGPCQTIYNFDTKLPDVKMTTFVRDTDIDEDLDGRRLQGPTVFVYFEKPDVSLPLFRGLHYPNPKTLGVYSFAKVYYTRKVGDTQRSPGNNKNKRIEGKETLFNPFWAARLELPKISNTSNPLFH